MTVDWSIVAPVMAIVSALAAPVVAYRLAARRFSGAVTTSAAEELWSESRSIREDYRHRLELANERIGLQDTRIGLLSQTIDELRRENDELKAMLNRTINGNGG